MNHHHQPNVLLADDEPMIVAALTRSLRRYGVECIADTASVGVMELAIAYRPEVIILDVRQAIDGRDLLAKLKRDERTRDLRVLMLSAVDDPFTRQLCLELGADDYEVKPYDSLFVDKVARLAGRLSKVDEPDSPGVTAASARVSPLPQGE